mmetsp:Transcript_11195/g.23869  ORF Transcript_11195/g.23869 Transcript_11195/m.23869 type:complete len:742 (-) Transcript_11195:790-3015(-)
MVLPPVEKSPVLLIRFTPKASNAVIVAVIDALATGGMFVIESEGLYDETGKIIATGRGNHNRRKDPVVLGLTTTQELLENEAETLKLVMPSRTSLSHIDKMMEPFSRKAKGDFVHMEHENDEDYDEHGLFNTMKRALLVESMVRAIEAPASLTEKNNTKKTRTSMIGALTFTELVEEHTPSLVEVLKQNNYIDVISAIHSKSIKKRIEKSTYSIIKPLPIQAIRDYYGEQIAFYFAWMHHMTVWYIFPGMLGLVVFVLRKYRGETVDNCELIPFMGLITFFWAVLCNWYWERKEATLAFEWGTFALTKGDRLRLNLDKRPGFQGTMQQSPITGKMEKYYSPSKRNFKRAISVVLSLFLLAGACGVMIISMNLQGYISRADAEVWGENNHPLYFPFFSQFAEEGGLFDANSTWKCLPIILLRAIIVANMNQKYSELAVILAEWENHETQRGHRNSIILKRVLFEAFDAYIILFYLAVYERDVELLRLELVGTFSVDTFRRVFIECVIPYAVRHFSKDPVSKAKKDDDLKEKSSSNGHLTFEADLEEYDTFDDYIEMLIQFGYVTLFASAFPLAAFVAMAANLIEMRADLWKLSHVFRRTTPLRASDIGMWKMSLKAIAWLSACSNLLIFAFTSSQLRQWLPDYYVTDAGGQSAPKDGYFVEILLIVVCIEHFIIIIAGLARKMIPKIPESVSVGIQKQLWYHETVASKARCLTVQSKSNEVKSLSRRTVPNASTRKGDERQY